MARFLTEPFSLSYLETDITSPGRLVLCRCPGLRASHAGAATFGSEAALESDLATIIDSGATSLISLIGFEERRLIGIPGLPRLVGERGLKWHEFAIPDRTAPDRNRQREFRDLMSVISDGLSDGHIIAIHCRAGLGRTGLVAASVLVSRGLSPDAAILAVRTVRPGAIETSGQEAFVSTVEPAR